MLPEAGAGVGIGISVAAFPFPLGGLHSRAAAFTDFEQANQNKQAKDAEDNPNYTPETDACVVFLCVYLGALVGIYPHVLHLLNLCVDL